MATIFVRSSFRWRGPNGIGLSPDERELYVAETPTGRLWAYELSGPGQLTGKTPYEGRMAGV